MDEQGFILDMPEEPPAEGEQVTEPSDRGISPAFQDEQETRLPVFGDIRLHTREFQIVDHPAFQRLFDFNQLGQTNLVFRGATHRRGEHALGTTHVAQLIIDRIARVGSRDPGETLSAEWTVDRPLSNTEIAFARLGALLHDIGHLPAGHTLEDELGLFEKHDSRSRIRMVFERKTWRDEDVEPLGSLVDRLYAEEASETGIRDENDDPLSASVIVELIVASDRPDAINSSPDFRIQVLQDIVGNTICADLLDYLHRDWLHLGKPRYFDHRIIEYFEPRRRLNTAGTVERKLVINLRNRIRPRNDAVTLILDLLENRYQLNEIALFHRTKLAAASMLERALAELFEEASLDKAQFLDALLEWSDLELLSEGRKLARGRGRKKNEAARARLAASAQLLRALRVRKLHNEVTAVWANDVGGAVVSRIVELYQSGPDPTPGSKSKQAEERQQYRQSAAKARLQAIRRLEEDFFLPVGTLTMYCPPEKMNPKIAEVNVLFEGHVAPLSALEDSSNKAITGGHLDAQHRRFSHLWHASLFCHEDELEKMEPNVRLALVKAFRYGVLGIMPEYGSQEEVMEGIARELFDGGETSPSPSVRFAGESMVAARMNPSALVYPSGVRCIRSYLTE